MVDVFILRKLANSKIKDSLSLSKSQFTSTTLATGRSGWDIVKAQPWLNAEESEF